MIKEIDGNLITLAQQGAFDVLVHGCNCQCNMGGGIANVIREVYPHAYVMDCCTVKGDREKLGTFTASDVQKPVIINLYTQYDYRGRGKLVDYVAIENGFKALAVWFDAYLVNYPHAKIGAYRIGCSRGGGDWAIVEKLMTEYLGRFDVTIVNTAGS